ncbi:hypothetical protein GLOIN_2v1835304 [Rhizophagus clarus]|uniref:Uncharacterized protein n=1 Tax=Rhizophagus clarus TaxID=94130 RepID=A0A8H3KXR6_9GLOM|nr:hypothetical protein GLOIN_2v1835304 [Rhizophagus clarus]
MVRLFGLDEQNAGTYKALSKQIQELEKQLENYHFEYIKLKRRVILLKAEIEDLDKYVDREAVIDLIHKIALSLISKLKSDWPKALRVKHLTSLTNIPPKSTSSESSSFESSSCETSSSESSLSFESSSSESSLSESNSSSGSNLSKSSLSSKINSSESSSSDSDIDEIEAVIIGGLVSTGTDWYFILHNTEGIYSTSRTEYQISLTEDVLDDDTDLRKNVKRVLEVIRIIELEAENAEIPELRNKLAKIPELRKKLAEVEARNVKIEARNEELMKRMIKENNRRDARIEKLEEKQLQNNNTPNNILSNFNSDAIHHEKPLEEKEMDNFLLETHKKIVSSEIKQRNKEKKLHTESMTSSGQEVAMQSGQNSYKKKSTEKIVQVITDGMMAEPSIQDNMTEISAMTRHPKCSSSLLDLAHLFDKASDAEYHTKKANEKEILYWVNFGKEFIYQYNKIVENSNGKIGEKKAKGIIYDEMLEHLATIREKRSKEMGIQLPKISCSSLTRRTQRVG